MMPVEALMLAMAERGWSSEQEAAAILDKLEKWGFSLVADIELERVWLARDADTRPSWLRRLLAMGWEVVPAAEAGIGRELARVCRMFALEACEGSE